MSPRADSAVQENYLYKVLIRLQVAGGPGSVIWQTMGSEGSCNPDSIWVTSPLLDLPRYVPLGQEYWLQIEVSTRGS